ncbi:MAG: aldehyde dehydrogenase, partial [SAR324 cluster bacterium]
MHKFEGKILIEGKWKTPDSGETLPVIDPSDGCEFGRIARGSAVDIDLAVKSAQNAMQG